MKWKKKGLIFGPDGHLAWAKSHCLQPTPLLLGEKIRLFVGFRDDDGKSRVGYVDVAADDPSRVLHVTQEPVLDLGTPGAFDEHGVVPSAIVARGEELFLYYAGYQRLETVRFRVLGGLAVSRDEGRSFHRHSSAPVFGVTESEKLFRVPHTVLFDDGVWKAWYGGGSEFRQGALKTLPVYDIRLVASKDGIHFPDRGETVVNLTEDEYRVARPYVVKGNNGYRMFYCYASMHQEYRLGFADSSDGKHWTRKDSEMGLEPSIDEWDHQMMGYPAVVQWRERTYLFYNGNRYGEKGFGYAELIES
jgi:hypothetical protein